jgi:hypothetical protein
MKRTIIILLAIVSGGVSFAGGIVRIGGPIQNSFTVSDPFTPEQYINALNGYVEIDERDELRNLLKRCLEFIPDDPPGVEYVDEESMKRKQLRRDIKAAIDE